MKAKIHPNYDFVLFRCPSTGTEILTRSTKLSGPKMKVQEKDIPTISVEICSDNHPFYSGQKLVLDTAGRVDAFKKRFGTGPVQAPKLKVVPVPPPAPKPEKKAAAPAAEKTEAKAEAKPEKKEKAAKK